MWEGEILEGAESTVFGHGAHRLTDEIRNMIPMDGKSHSPHGQHQTGIGIFDELTPEQQIVLVDRIVAYLLDPSLVSPSRTAYLDATVAAVYAQIFVDIEIEIDRDRMPLDEGADEDNTEVRRMVLVAVQQQPDGQPGPIEGPPVNSDDVDAWESAVQTLRDRVLPDEDWLLSSMALDLPPTDADLVKGSMGISGNYFSDAAPDATRSDARRGWSNMVERLTGERIAEWRFGDQRVPFVMLTAVVESMEMVPDEWGAFLDKSDCKISLLPLDLIEFVGCEENDDEYFGDITGEMLKEATALVDGDNFVELPGKFEIHEWEIMRDFCQTIGNDGAHNELQSAIHGSGAFRSFRSALARLQLVDDWYQFREQAMERIAIEWLETNNIAWLRESDLER